MAAIMVVMYDSSLLRSRSLVSPPVPLPLTSMYHPQHKSSQTPSRPINSTLSAPTPGIVNYYECTGIIGGQAPALSGLILEWSICVKETMLCISISSPDYSSMPVLNSASSIGCPGECIGRFRFCLEYISLSENPSSDITEW